MKIIDNFLSDYEFNLICEQTIDNHYFPLFLKKDVAYENSNDGIYFTHKFFNDGKVTSNFFHILNPILNKINPKQILRIQFNLYPKTILIKRHAYHIDFDFPHNGLIYYLNSNNGKTILKNKVFNKKIKSIQNRALLFDPSKKHASTTCTNQRFRSNIIFNYI
jgi:uncharacterized protein YbcV (DUF1398 family)